MPQLPGFRAGKTVPSRAAERVARGLLSAPAARATAPPATKLCGSARGSAGQSFLVPDLATPRPAADAQRMPRDLGSLKFPREGPHSRCIGNPAADEGQPSRNVLDDVGDL